MDRFIVDERNNLYRFINIFLNILSVIMIFIRYNLILNMKKLNNGTLSNFGKIKFIKIKKNIDNFFSYGITKYFILEIIINSICIPPYVSTSTQMNGTIYVDYSYSDFFTSSIPIDIEYFNTDQTKYTYLKERNVTSIDEYFKSKKVSVKLRYNISTYIVFIMMFRIYHFFRLVHTFSEWNTPRAEIICNYLNCKADISFGIKAILKKYPSLCLIFGIFFIVIFFGIGLNIFEYYNRAQMSCMGTGDTNNSNGMVNVMLHFSDLLNSFWLVIVTMTTSKINYLSLFI